MIIHQPEIIQKDGKVILWSKIELSKKRDHFPNYIWYRIPENYAAHLNTQSDAFLVSSLLAAMHFGEDIQVRGTISPRLAYHLEEYQYLLNFRMPKVLQKISVQYENLAPIKEKPTGVGTTFSGGIDSLYTIWKHLPQNQISTDFQVTHGIFIRGFDILHTENNHYMQLFNQFKKQTATTGIELIELDTNMLSIAHQRMNLSYLYGPFIISTGLALSGLLQRFYVPSSWDYYTLHHTTHGSDPLLDGFLSTDSIEIIHHGSTSRRVEKVEELANWEIAQKLLWVCLDAKFKEHSWNCSRCEKCVRTMIPLYTLGVMEKYIQFEKPIQKNWEVIWYARKFNLRSNYLTELFPYLRNHKPELIPWLYLASILGHLRHWAVKNLPKFIKHWLRSYGYFVTSDEAPDAYEIHQITELIQKKE
ncbi:MAG: hypothetical protein GY755_09520 [Chloroflexi bacterium]|nr:hypothetical protein [Chloroflexota bacterium]